MCSAGLPSVGADLLAGRGPVLRPQRLPHLDPALFGIPPDTAHQPPLLLPPARAEALYGFYLLLFSTLVFCAIDARQITLRAALGEFFFVQNYLGGLWGHTWSLAVEEHFYLILLLLRGSQSGWPAFLAATVRLRLRRGRVPRGANPYLEICALRVQRALPEVAPSLRFAVLRGPALPINVYARLLTRLPGLWGLLLLALFGPDSRLADGEAQRLRGAAMAKMGVFSYSISICGTSRWR